MIVKYHCLHLHTQGATIPALHKATIPALHKDKKYTMRVHSSSTITNHLWSWTRGNCKWEFPYVTSLLRHIEPSIAEQRGNRFQFRLSKISRWLEYVRQTKIFALSSLSKAKSTVGTRKLGSFIRNHYTPRYIVPKANYPSGWDCSSLSFLNIVWLEPSKEFRAPDFSRCEI